MLDGYEEYDGLGLAELVRARKTSPEELLAAAVSRAELLNPRLNAIIRRMDNEALRAAEDGLPDGPFRGVPFLIKDLLADYAGAPIHSGSRLLRGYVSRRDSEVVARYKRAGLVIFGKTNTPEFGLLPVTEPLAFGPTRNPWDLGRTPGGSSGGSAAAVAARIVPIASGGDGGGSIRIPASCCGLFGLKPSRGRVPTGPERGELWAGAVAEHVLTRSVRDSAAMLDALAGPDAGASYSAPPPSAPFLRAVAADPRPLRIAATAEPFLVGRVDLHPACRRGLDEAKKLLVELGHEVEEAAPAVDQIALSRAFLTMLCVELAAEFAEIEPLLRRKVRLEDVEPATWALKLLGEQISGREHALALRTLQRASRQLGEFFSRYDVLLTPTLAAPPLPIGSQQITGAEERLIKLVSALRAGRALKVAGVLERNAEQAFAFTPYTPLFNITGQPAMSVPLHWEGGLPIGAHFAGRYGEEETLLSLAGQLERARPWADRRPPLLEAAA